MNTLPHVVLKALREADFEVLKPRVMGVDRYLVIGRKLDPEMLDATRHALAKDAASRALDVARSSFFSILRSSQQSELDWNATQLDAVRCRARIRGEKQWIEYSELEGETRVDAFVDLRSPRLQFGLKLDDCFLVNRTRHLGGGLRVYRSHPLDDRPRNRS